MSNRRLNLNNYDDLSGFDSKGRNRNSRGYNDFRRYLPLLIIPLLLAVLILVGTRTVNTNSNNQNSPNTGIQPGIGGGPGFSPSATGSGIFSTTPVIVHPSQTPTPTPLMIIPTSIP